MISPLPELSAITGLGEDLYVVSARVLGELLVASASGRGGSRWIDGEGIFVVGKGGLILAFNPHCSATCFCASVKPWDNVARSDVGRGGGRLDGGEGVVETVVLAYLSFLIRRRALNELLSACQSYFKKSMYLQDVLHRITSY